MQRVSGFLVLPLVLSLLLCLLPSSSARPAVPALLCGSSNPGRVYMYMGGKSWVPISPVLGYSVLCMAEYRGELYVGTTSEFGMMSGVGRVWKFDGSKWELVGDGLDHNVNALVVYKGKLYAGTSLNGTRVYRYEGGKRWTLVVDYHWYPWGNNWYGVRCMREFKGNLIIGDTFWDLIALWNGKEFYPVQPYETGSCIYDLEEYRGRLFGSAYRGRIWVSEDGWNWSLMCDFDYGKGNIWEMEVFRGKLYMGYQSGELRVWDGEGDVRGELVYTAPAPIISMESDGVSLYFGTGGDAAGFGEAREGLASVYRYDGEKVELISEEDQFGSGVQVLYRMEGWKDLHPTAHRT
ncbi:MAG: hypothetical protein QXH26_04790 [Candidatus Hadarchaeales archaeon]